MDIALNLVLNTALLISISILFNLYYLKFQKHEVLQKILGGIVLGFAGVILMKISFNLPDGGIFDTRSILVSVSGLFYGVLPTTVAVIIITLYRLFLGGAGTIMGIVITALCAAIGLVWRVLSRGKGKSTWFMYYFFGIVTHLVMLICMFLLPWGENAEALRTIGFSVLAIFPIGTTAMCLIIDYERKNLQTELLLNDSEIRFRAVFEQAPVGVIVEKSDSILYINPAYEKILGRTKEQISGTDWQSYTHPEDIALDLELFEKTITGEIDRYDFVKRYLKPDGSIIWAHVYISVLDRAEKTINNDYICIAQDITEEMERETSLRESEKKYRELSLFFGTLLESIPDHIIYKDINGIYLGCNRAFEQASGILKSDMIGKNDVALFGQETAELFQRFDSICLCEQREVRSDEMVVYPDGHSIITETLKTPYYDSDGELAGVIGISRDITDRKKKEDWIQYLSIHDMMTGLYSRMHFDSELYRLDAAGELPYSVIMGDINSLKLTNDLFGHNEGDKLIVETANLLKSCCEQGIVARTGGDEFSVILPQTGSEDVARIVSQINQMFETHKNRARDSNYFLSVSIGYATKSAPNQTISEILKTAEENMYRRKLLEHQSIRSSLLTTIKTLLFSKSNETMEHAERMAGLAKRLGSEVDLHETDLVSLELMATLHDVGKIGISNNILSKPGALDEAEWAEIRKHPEIGYRIALTIPELQGIAGYILCHHERWDGSGYPQGLAGEEIPYIARMISVIDSYDAMTEDRSYRKAMSREAAAKELIDNAGTQFDPQIAQIFIERVLQLPFSLTAESRET